MRLTVKRQTFDIAAIALGLGLVSVAAARAEARLGVAVTRGLLLAWLAARPDVEAAGAPYGVYWNAPYVPPFLKRFEVHVPVRPRTAAP